MFLLLLGYWKILLVKRLSILGLLGSLRMRNGLLKVLVENGIEVDSSYRGLEPSVIRYNGIEIKEMPINYTRVFGRDIIFSGGGYFRLFPYSLIKHWTKNSDYIMSYLHPRYPQPILKFLRKFKLLA